MTSTALKMAAIAGLAAVVMLVAPVAQAQDAAKEKPSASKTRTYTGVIESVDAAAGTITVKHSTKKDTTKTFKIGEGCKFRTADKAAAAIADFKAGDKIVLKYTGADGEQLVAVDIQNHVEKEKKPKKTE